MTMATEPLQMTLQLAGRNVTVLVTLSELSASNSEFTDRIGAPAIHALLNSIRPCPQEAATEAAILQQLSGLSALEWANRTP